MQRADGYARLDCIELVILPEASENAGISRTSCSGDASATSRPQATQAAQAHGSADSGLVRGILIGAGLALSFALFLHFVVLATSVAPPPLKSLLAHNPELDQRIFIRDGGFGHEGVGSAMQHFKESIIIAEALGATFLVTRMQSEHGYSTSDFINSPAALEAAVRVDAGRTCSLQDFLRPETRRTLVAAYCGREATQAHREHLIRTLANCSVILDAEKEPTHEDLNGCIQPFVRKRLGFVPDSPWQPTRVTVGIHIRWGDAAKQDKTAGQFRGSMRMDNINRILRDLHAEFGTDNLDVTVAMEGHDDVVLAQLDTPQWRVVDTGNVTHDLRALAANNVLLLGGSSFGLLAHLIAPRGLTIVEMGRGHQKYDNTSAFGRLSVKMPDYNPEVLKRLPALVSPV